MANDKKDKMEGKMLLVQEAASVQAPPNSS